jgi:co-chaperonin GroES (HSP10)
MPLEPVVSALRVRHTEDPRDLIWRDMGVTPGKAQDKYGDLVSKVRVGGEDVLIVRYERREDKGKDIYSEGGIILPEDQAKNDKWQSNSGLIVKMGPRAYKTEKAVRWFVGEGAENPEIGDWVLFNPNNGHGFMLGDRFCFLTPAQYVFLVLAQPDIVQ